ncbi:MAG: formate dehydrogenase accessory sulfurtransferase FdhD [Pseudomonadota bacterium]
MISGKDDDPVISPELAQEFEATRFMDGFPTPRSIHMAREIPYTLFINDYEILSISTLPIHLEELFIGFMVSEGVLLEQSEIVQLRVDKASRIVSMEINVPEDRLDRVRKKGMLTSGCAGGITFSVETAAKFAPRISSRITIPAEVISKRMKDVDSYKGIYSITRGTHAAAVGSLTETGPILEDIGRHNAIDKIIGYCFMNRLNTDSKILLTTGRITSEAVSKAVRAGFPIIVSRSSASATAVSMAMQAGLDVVTYARAGRFNFFGHGATQITPKTSGGTDTCL